MLLHVTDTALSHSATKTQLTILKQELEAPKKDYTSLKEDYTTLKEDYTSLKKGNEVKMKVVEIKLLSCTPRNISTTTSQLYTLLVDTSTMERGSTLSLALSESNTESGHHYIILEGYKFKLEWRFSTGLISPSYIISLYLVRDETLSEDWGCRFNISLNNAGPKIITVMGGWEDEVFGHAVSFKCGGHITALIILVKCSYSID